MTCAEHRTPSTELRTVAWREGLYPSLLLRLSYGLARLNGTIVACECATESGAAVSELK